MELFVSTQNAYETQVSPPVKHRYNVSNRGSLKRRCLRVHQCLVAKVLGVPVNRVVVRVKRMGGGFGGKESRSTTLSTVVAVAANKYNEQPEDATRWFPRFLIVVSLVPG